MLFERLFIQNLGIFRGEHYLDLLSRDPARPIVLVGALNGSGKTTVIESIQLSLYGKRAGFGWRGTGSYSHYLNQIRNRSANPGEPTVAEVSLQLADSRRLRVRRQWSYMKDTPREYVSVFINGEEQPDLVLSETWDDEVERLLPARLSELFFFDGERIESLADPARSGDVLRTAVASLLGLDLVDQLAGDLEILRARQRQKMLSDAEQAQFASINLEHASQHQVCEDLVYEIGQVRNRITRTEQQLADVQRRAREQGGERFLRREQVALDRVKFAAQLASAEDRLREAAAGSLPLLLVQDQLHALRKDVDEQRPEHSQEAIAAVKQHMKQLSAWVRRRDFPAKVRDEITEYVTKRIEALPEAGTLPLSVNWPYVAGQLSSLLEERLPRAKSAVTRLVAEEKSLAQRIDVLEEKLKKVPEQDQIAGVFKEQGAVESALKASQNELNGLIQDERNQRKKLEDIARKRRELGNKSVEAGDAQRTAEYCERSIKTLSEFRKKLVQKRREQLEALILEAFKMLSRKPDLIGHIHLDPETMMIRLVTGQGETVETQQLSAGERQLLAVAMLWGLARASGRPVPVVIDTPLGRLDGEHRRALLERYFPDASHQVILLSTDKEVDADFSRLLDESVAHRYLIGYNPHERTSSFSEGYFSK